MNMIIEDQSKEEENIVLIVMNLISNQIHKNGEKGMIIKMKKKKKKNVAIEREEPMETNQKLNRKNLNQQNHLSKSPVKIEKQLKIYSLKQVQLNKCIL